jgi:DNA-directed RNA polymerase subunit K/omega
MADFEDYDEDAFTEQDEDIDEEEEDFVEELATEVEEENENENEIEEEKGEIDEELEVEIEAELEGETEVEEIDTSMTELDEEAVKKKNLLHVKKEKYTNPYMTKYEFTKIIGVRAEQLLYGAQQLVKTKETCPIKIAVEELKQRRLPFIVRRKNHQKTNRVLFEDWQIEEFKNVDELISFYDY